MYSSLPDDGAEVAEQGVVPDLYPMNNDLIPKSFSYPRAIQSNPQNPVEDPLLGDAAAYRDSEARRCSLLSNGSISGSIFNLCSATLGAGALSLPIAISNSGLVLGNAFLLVGYVATVLSINMLLRARKITGCSSYEELTTFLFGKWMTIAVEIGITIFCFGTCVSYTIAIGDILQPLTMELNKYSSLFNVYSMTILFWLLFMVPLSLLKRINNLRFTSFFGVMMIFYLVIVVMSFSSSHHFSDHLREVKLVNAGFDLLKTIPLILFAFSCQVNVYQIQTELDNPTDLRLKRVNYIGIGVPLIVYILIGSFGYVAFPVDTPGNIFKGLVFPQPEILFSVFIAIAYVGMACTVVMAFPLNIFPMRHTILSMVVGVKGAEEIYAVPTVRNNVIHYGLSSFFCVCSLVIALLIRQIEIVFQVVGGTASAFVCFIVPALFIIKLRLMKTGDISTRLYISAWVLTICAAVLGLWSTYLSIFD